jgi:putative N6-adenine-specific DNA methylase
LTGFKERYFVSIQPGLEAALEDELSEFGLSSKRDAGGVEVSGDREMLHKIHLWSRLASRVTVRVGAFPAKTLDELARRVRALHWERYAQVRQPVVVRVTAHKSRLRHRETVARKVTLAIQDALRGPRVSRGRPPREALLVVIRIVEDRVVVSVDASGEGLHRRGWRREGGAAPLRENLAAGVLRMLQWAPGEPLVDPMCGSGTFPIEAATIAQGKAPGIDRSFGFELWPSHERSAWHKTKARAARHQKPGAGGGFFGSDRDKEAIDRARMNARRAGLRDQISWLCCPVGERQPPLGSPGLLVMNPPYGKRLAKGQAASVYAGIGRAMRQDWSGWRVGILLPRTSLLKDLALPVEPVATFAHGGLRVTLVAGVVR